MGKGTSSHDNMPTIVETAAFHRGSEDILGRDVQAYLTLIMVYLDWIINCDSIMLR